MKPSVKVCGGLKALQDGNRDLSRWISIAFRFILFYDRTERPFSDRLCAVLSRARVAGRGRLSHSQRLTHCACLSEGVRAPLCKQSFSGAPAASNYRALRSRSRNTRVISLPLIPSPPPPPPPLRFIPGEEEAAAPEQSVYKSSTVSLHKNYLLNYPVLISLPGDCELLFSFLFFFVLSLFIYFLFFIYYLFSSSSSSSYKYASSFFSKNLGNDKHITINIYIYRN